MLFGHSAPFDRHDWVVDRGGEEIRYVIDYYHDESGVDKDALPAHMHDFNAMKSIVVDVRPAVDSVQAVVDRVFRMPLAQVVNSVCCMQPMKKLNFRMTLHAVSAVSAVGGNNV